MSSRIRIFSLFTLLVFTWSCKKENWCDCVKSTGKDETTTRDVQGFTCINLEDKIDMYIKQGPNFEVKVQAGEHLQKLIKTELDGETLKVVNNNKCNFVRGYKHKITVYVTAPRFKFIDHNGVGTIWTDGTIVQDTIGCKTHSSGDIHLNVNSKVMLCSTHGNGDIYLAGVTDNLQNDYTGTNFLYAKDLKVNSFIYLHSVSLGHAYVNAPPSGNMDIRIEQSGNVYYTGSPSAIQLTRTGKGQLIKD
ncbi:MAG: DUF2807 domain-containing protein [Bacteroidetes bacterium]|nr:DUF2807 domain-containing protein [Bacteroidota bacterium]